MGNVVEQTRLGLHQRFQSRRHGVEIAHQSRDFVAPAAVRVSRARRKVPGGQLLRRGSQPRHRLGHIPGKKITNQSGRNIAMISPGIGIPRGPKNTRGPGGKLHHQRVAMLAIGRSSRIALYGRAREK